MARRKRRHLTDEQKAEAVRRVRESDRRVYPVARELDLTETALRRWVGQAEIDEGRGTAEGLRTALAQDSPAVRARMRASSSSTIFHERFP